MKQVCNEHPEEHFETEREMYLHNINLHSEKIEALCTEEAAKYFGITRQELFNRISKSMDDAIIEYLKKSIRFD